MFTIEEVLSKRNQRDALAHFSHKKEGCGPDKMLVSDLPEYWNLNKEKIMTEILEQRYKPGYVQQYELLNKSGKKRTISNFNVIDRFITRLLSQKLNRYLQPIFLQNSYAYQDGKGIVDAIEKAKEYIESGDHYVVEIDLSNYFDTIPLDKLMIELQERISDKRVISVIEAYLYCEVLFDGQIVERKRGVLQGNSMSPVLSNLYLHALDVHMEEKGYHWVQFADDINIYAKTADYAEEIYKDVCDVLKRQLHLAINEKKSGIVSAENSTYLGYDFVIKKKGVEVRKHKYKVEKTYHNWHPSRIQVVNKEYHLLANGVINKKDYALLF